MNLIIDKKYLKSLNLKGFEKKSENLFVFRCPICGDSKKSTSKKRCYANKHKKKEQLYIYCHNCSFGANFSYFLKTININLFQQYRNEIQQERLKKKKNIKVNILKKEKVIDHNFIINEECKNVLNAPNYVIEYLKNRMINEKYFSEIFWTLNFKKYVNSNYIKKYENTDRDDERIIFPIFNNSNKLIGLQGRSLFNENYRYLTVKLKDDEELFYGIHRIKENSDVYITEGIFDSLMFGDQGIAMLGSSKKIDGLIKKNKFNNVYMIFDNEPNNKFIYSNMKRFTNSNSSLFIWPMKGIKDINEFRMRMSSIDLIKFVQKFSYKSDSLKRKILEKNWKNKK